MENNLPEVQIQVTRRTSFLSDKYVLSVVTGSDEHEDRYDDKTEIDASSPKDMELLKMGVFLLNCLDRDEDKYSRQSKKKTKELEWVKLHNPSAGEIQRHIIFEAGKKLFLTHNPLRPICSLFPMGLDVIEREYPEYAKCHRGTLLIDEGWGKHEWPWLDDNLVHIQGWSVSYFDKDGKEYLVNTKVVGEKING